MPTQAPRDPYDVLGVTPGSDAEVIAAAHRALTRKFTAANDHRRAGEVSAAYDLLSNPERRQAYDAGRYAPPSRLPPPGAVAIVLICLALAGLASTLAPYPDPPPPSRHLLKVQKRAVQTGQARALPCYVGGQPIGDLPLTACAARNGVATGPLDVGLTEAATPHATPAAPQAARPAPTPSPAAPPVAQPVQTASAMTSTPSAARSMAVARAFYGALGGGDGYGAAALIEPEKRGVGPLSGPQMSRFYASLAEPLHLTSIYALDPQTVFVRYRFTTQDGGVCEGAANVITSQRGAQTFIHAIRAHNGC